MDEAGGEVTGCERRRRLGGEREHPHRIGAIIVARLFVEQVFQRVANEGCYPGWILMICQPLEAADPHMAVAQPGQHRRSCRRRLVIAG